MNVPFVDLRAQHDELRTEIDNAIRDIVDRSAFIGGAAVERFERNFAAYCGAEEAVGCASGTDALVLALRAVGVGPGDAVITVPNTFIATVEAITLAGAHPVFVDVDLDTYNISPAALTAYFETQTTAGNGGRRIDAATGRPVTALLPVHLYGLPVDMAPLWDLATRFELTIVEDACQAHGASYRHNGAEQRTGTLGQAAAFSFYPGKNLGAMGEAGAASTNDEEIARAMKVLRDHGQSERYIHISPDGWNGRLDGLQAAVLDIKLGRLDAWNEARRRAAARYRANLNDDPRIVLPIEPEYGRHVYHLFVVRVPDRDAIREKLQKDGIATGLHYPIPLHLQEAYRDLGIPEGAHPHAERAAREILSLPMYPHINNEQVDYVSAKLKEALG